MGCILVANPGSSSRKYALFDSSLVQLGALHFEHSGDTLACTLHTNDTDHDIPVDFTDLGEASGYAAHIFAEHEVMPSDESIERIGLRIVAPGAYFLIDRIIDDDVVRHLEQARELAPLHIDATLAELSRLREAYPHAQIIGISDSAFHSTKPGYAWNYAIDIHDADTHDIKRFGYHGISTAASIDALWNIGKLPPKVIVCHLGSGSSITAVFHGRSIDTTMGFTPLEGVMMASRSGTIDLSAALVLKRKLGLDDAGLEEYLHTRSGLLGITGSNDIRQVIEREANGDHMAHLGLTTLVHSYHKAIGQMLVAMNGCDMLVFTGTVGERSAIIRKRIVAHLNFADFVLDGEANDACTSPAKPTIISQGAKSRPIIVIPTDEAREIAKHVVHHTA